MEITTEEQASKVRSVMAAMIQKLQEAKDSKDKEATAQLKAQYSTLQAALQDYKQRAKEAQAEERATITALRDEIKYQKNMVKEANEEVVAAYEELASWKKQYKELRAKHSALLTERDTLKDEVRWMRNPAPVEDYRKALIMAVDTPSHPAMTERDIGEMVKAVTGNYPDDYDPQTGTLRRWLSKP